MAASRLLEPRRLADGGERRLGGVHALLGLRPLLGRVTQRRLLLVAVRDRSLARLQERPGLAGDERGDEAHPQGPAAFLPGHADGQRAGREARAKAHHQRRRGRAVAARRHDGGVDDEGQDREPDDARENPHGDGHHAAPYPFV